MWWIIIYWCYVMFTLVELSQQHTCSIYFKVSLPPLLATSATYCISLRYLLESNLATPLPISCKSRTYGFHFFTTPFIYIGIPGRQLCNFYTPVWKTDVLCRGNIRPSVCPSVRPRFPDFSSRCFEISIWNLVYTFSRWHDISSLSCITIGSLWPSLQPKVGQTHFLQSWSHKSR